jgi:hypothetical protein
MLAIACQCSVFARQTEVGRPPPFPSQSFFPPERRSFQRRVDCHLSKLKRIVADLALDKEMLQDVIKRKL